MVSLRNMFLVRRLSAPRSTAIALFAAGTVALSWGVAAELVTSDASAAACSVSGRHIYQRAGVSCSTSRRVLSRYFTGDSTKGWSCNRRDRQCNGSGLSIDSYRAFRWR